MPHQPIREWASQLSDWQSDALRRLLSVAQLDQSEYAEVFQNAKAAFGIGETAHCERHVDEDFDADERSDHEVSLLSIGPLFGVDRLASDQTLSFAPKGITLVYGGNGAGKSGYSRVLKQLCRAVSGARTPLRGNAFELEQQTQEVSFSYCVGDEPETTSTWASSDPSPKELGRISVFDSVAAGLYANEQNEIDFLPRNIDLISRLRRVIERVRSDSAAQAMQIRNALRAPLPIQRTTTSVGKKLSLLVSETEASSLPTERQLADAGSWSEELQEQLDQFRIKQASDPKLRAGTLDSAFSWTRRLAAEVYFIERVVRNSQIQLLRHAENQRNVARQAQDSAGKLQLGEEPIPQTGSDTWRLLFEAARTFAIESAYESPFGKVKSGDLCVLCQQPLDDSAADRMRRFHEFVAQESSIRLAAATASLEVLLHKYGKMQVGSLSDAKRAWQLARANSTPPEFDEAEALSSLVIAPDDQWQSAEEISQLSEDVPDGLAWRLMRLARSAKQESDRLKTEADDQVAERLALEIAELEDQKVMSENIIEITERLRQLIQLKKYAKLELYCSSARIARYITEMRRIELTDKLVEALEVELEGLGLETLPVTFIDKTKIDKSFGGVALDGVPIPIRNSEILSDGEQRALALAVFLAETQMISKGDAIVIDDPASSVDDQRMRKIARRLAEEGRKRQVIIFTHSMNFFIELHEAALEHQVPALFHYMFSEANAEYGLIDLDSKPWELKPLKERIAVLRATVQEIGDGLHPEKYKIEVKKFSSALRETWEQLVEEKLLYGVVRRYARPVATQKLRGVAVSDDDYSRVFFAMKRASEWSGHNAPPGAALAPPSKSEMLQEIEELQDYAKQIDRDRGGVEAPRKARVPD